MSWMPSMSSDVLLTWLVIGLILLVAAMFVVLFLQTLRVRDIVSRAEGRQQRAPEGSVDLGSQEALQCVKAFAVVARPDLARGLSPFDQHKQLVENVYLPCEAKGGGYLEGRGVECLYTRTEWLVLQRGEQELALHQGVLDGRLRYAMLPGGVVRIVAAGVLPPVPGIDAETTRVYVVADPSSVTRLDHSRDAVCGAHTTLYPPVSSDFSRVASALKAGAGSALNLHLLAYGWRSSAVTSAA